jgi:hypothetical protein
MECFTFKTIVVDGKPVATLKRGLQLISTGNGQKCLFLGEKGKGSVFHPVLLDRKNPPDIIDGMIMHAYPRTRESIDSTGWVNKRFFLKKPIRSRIKKLVRICTSSSMPKQTPGRWKLLSGNPMTIVSAYGRRNGLGIKWIDDLLIMNSGDVILVFPEGGTRYESVVIENAGGILTCLDAQRYLKDLKSRPPSDPETLPRPQDKEESLAESQPDSQPEVESPEAESECSDAEWNEAVGNMEVSAEIYGENGAMAGEELVVDESKADQPS